MTLRLRERLRWSDWPWAAKLALLLGLLAVAPLTVVSLVQSLAARSDLLAAARAQDLQQARNTAQAIDLYLSGVVSDLQVVALAPWTVRFLSSPQDPALRGDMAAALRQMRDSHGFDALVLTDSSGTVRLATEERMTGRSYVAARSFLNAVAGTAGLGEPGYDPQAGKVFLQVSAPVRTPDGVITGTAIGRVSLARIDAIIQGDTDFAGRAETGALWTADGIRLSEPVSPQLRFHPFERLAPDTASQLAAEGRFGPRTRELLAAVVPAPGLIARSRWLLYDAAADPHLAVDLGGQRVYASIVPLAGSRWLYGIFSPESAVLAAVQAQTRRNLAVALITGLLAVGAGFAAAHWASRPLRLVGQTANAIAAGDMTRRVGLRQKDEVGRLAAAFDAMAEALAQKEAELRGNADRLQQLVAEQTAALRNSEAELRALFAAMRDAIFIFDDEGRCLKVAPTRAASASQLVAEIRGHRLSEVFRAEQAAYFLTQIRRALDTWQTVHVEYDLVVNGSGVWLEAAISPLLERSVVWVARDITWRKRSEEERRDLLLREQEARHRAEEANRIKDEFLSTLSHELRTPLNAMLGWAWLLKSGGLDADRTARAVDAIERNAKAQSQIIDDLLDMSRIVTGKLRLKVRRIDLAQTIEAAVDAMRPAVDAKEIRLELVPPSEPLPVSGDPNRLQQVVWNLLANAVKFTPPHGRIEVRLGRFGSQAEIRVSDDGIGIRHDFLAYVFDRFRQADSSTTRNHGGLGLGLAIVRHLVELHGGTVQAESAGEGQGSAFTVRLPIMPLRSLREPSPAATPAELPAGEPPDGFGEIRGLRVLLVDDEADIREMLPVALARFGARVTATASAAEALAALDGCESGTPGLPDVLVADIGMPDVDGYELIRQVRGRGGRCAELPALALTAYAAEADRRRALDAGFQLHMAKPFEPHQLAAALASLAGRTIQER